MSTTNCSMTGKNYAILKRRDLTPGPDGVIEFVVEAPLIARHAQAGSVRHHPHDGSLGERIPLTIAAYDRAPPGRSR